MIDLIFGICIGCLLFGTFLMGINLFRDFNSKFIYPIHVISSLFVVNGAIGTVLVGMYKIFLAFKTFYESMNG